MFKNIIFIITFDMFFNPSFKIKASFAKVARSATSTSKFIY